MTPRKWCLPGATGLMSKQSTDTEWHTQGLGRFKPQGIPALKGRSGHGVPPLTRKLSAGGVFWERENQFPPRSVSGDIKHTPGQDTCVQAKQNPCLFFFFYFICCGLFMFFVLLGFLLVLILVLCFVCFLREEECETEQTRKDLG